MPFRAMLIIWPLYPQTHADDKEKKEIKGVEYGNEKNSSGEISYSHRAHWQQQLRKHILHMSEFHRF